MLVPWGTKRWQVLSALFIIFILGYGTFTIMADLMTGHPIWWYNASFILFGFTLLGLCLLVREGSETLKNISSHGFNPTLTEEQPAETPNDLQEYIDDSTISRMSEEE